MGRPYSIDLRERAVAAVEKGGMSRRQAAAQFGVGVSTVIAWVQLLRKTGSVAPGKMGGHKPKAKAFFGFGKQPLHVGSLGDVSLDRDCFAAIRLNVSDNAVRALLAAGEPQ